MILVYSINPYRIMDEIDIYATAIITILSIAYPLILQVISKLDDTYGSSRIVELFEAEPVRKWFQIQLYVSLLSVFLWSLKRPPIYPFSDLGWIINNSASLLVIGSTFLLVIAFLRLVKKVFVFSTMSGIVRYLIKKHNEGH